uniref:Uncharacterized protein n=2 Tax=Vibrio TaxID=662 RepID=A0A0H3ZV20_9VIBR|nr:hypothetical protein [Vibrio kanaloae]AKN38306.1 hypothetical protein [Vibrio sp. 1S_269]AKN37374.1 hypothetical protein [Vibrio kanaloae]AKN38868.1 hypothetical protein [Vibrio kanaloae]AKN40110.1 hypothetical protein [Vibrio kanaloae]
MSPNDINYQLILIITINYNLLHSRIKKMLWRRSPTCLIKPIGLSVTLKKYSCITYSSLSEQR